MKAADVTKRLRVRSSSPVGDWSTGAAFVGLTFITGTAISAFSNSAGDAVLLVAAVLGIMVQLTRLSRAPLAITTSVLVFCAVYLAVSLVSLNSSQGLRHAATAITATGALLLFVNFGRDMVKLRWFRGWAYVLICAGLVGANLGGSAKNISAGVTLYLLALLTLLLLTSTRRAAPIVIAFFAAAATLAFALDFRSLIGYAAVLMLAFVGASTLPKRLFWFAGVAGSIAIITTTTWYFLNVQTNELAIEITRIVSESSGRPATSGREWLWPYIIHTVQVYSPWIGLGPGTLPRDIMPTELSSHSYYIQVYLQLGSLGLALLSVLLLSVWRPLAASRSVVGRFGAAVFLMFVAHNATEVIMFQNGLIAAVPAWCAIGLAISFAQGEGEFLRSTAPALAALERSDQVIPGRLVSDRGRKSD